MLAETDLGEYLAEIRKEVCSRCVERPPGGPPCAPVGKTCGIEMHLPQLIDSIHEVHSPMLQPYLDHDRKAICEKCAFLHSSICPCPMDYLSALLVEAVETVDQQRANRGEEVRGWGRPGGIAEMRRIFEANRGTWTGCDWRTRFGKTGLDLEGLTSREAKVMAEKNRGTAIGEDWEAAARWLAQVEQEARQAEARAGAAVAAAEAGHWYQALHLAEQAWAMEFGTGRAIWHAYPLAWERLLETTQGAFLKEQSELVTK